MHITVARCEIPEPAAAEARRALDRLMDAAYGAAGYVFSVYMPVAPSDPVVAFTPAADRAAGPAYLAILVFETDLDTDGPTGPSVRSIAAPPATVPAGPGIHRVPW